MTLKNIQLENARPRWNTWFLVQEIHLHTRRTSTRNEQMPTRSSPSRMDDQRKDRIHPEGLNQGNRPKQLHVDDVENINRTNKGKIFSSR